MEKVVIIYGNERIYDYKADEVNKYLNEGWTVKSVNMAATKEGTTAIFVLEKK